MYPLMSVRPELGTVNCRTGKIVFLTSQRAHSMLVQRTFRPFLIRYIFVLSVIHLLHVRLLTVRYPLLIRHVAYFLS